MITRPCLFALWITTSTLLLTEATTAQSGPSLSAVGTQTLQFGPVMAGVPTAISALDRSNAGRLLISGSRNTDVSVQFVLPQDLISTQGAALPIIFGPNDGAYSSNPSVQNAQVFDPRNALVARTANNGRLYIFLGGTVQPKSNQPAGTYSARVVLTVTYSGV